MRGLTRHTRYRAAGLAAGLGVLALPGPAQAKPFPGSWGYFATPSGRIVCGHGTRGIVCTNFAPARDPKTGEPGQKTWFVRRRGHGFKRVVVGNAPAEAPKGEYGVTYREHGFTCRIHITRGITCKNRQGHGFRVSVEHQKTF